MHTPGRIADAYFHPVAVVATAERRFGWQLRSRTRNALAWSVRTRSSLRGAEADIQALRRALANAGAWQFTAVEEDSEWWWTAALDGVDVARAAVGAWNRVTALKKAADFVTTGAGARMSRVLLVAAGASLR
ncbi:MAG: hypothetical protein WDM88_10815 [Galbitalea sp.]